MRTNARLFWFLTAFYILAAVGYAVWSYNDTAWRTGENKDSFEIIGTAAISMLVFLSGFIAFYLQKTHRTQGPAPEDREDGKIEEGAGEIGFFAPFSWWPFFLGLFGALAFTSLAVGWWLFIIALPLALVAIIGFVFEFSRGQHAH
jgi:heme/copper-type cytochrome/quinol oxidase subunit 2